MIMVSKKKAKKKTKKKATRKAAKSGKKGSVAKKTAKKTAAKKKSAKKKSTKKKSAKKAAARKKTSKKKAAKKTTAADLRKRAAEAEVQTEAEAPQAQAADPMAAMLGGLPLPEGLDLGNLDLSNVQSSLKGITEFVEQNPIASAAVALGAGVALTSIFWDKNKSRNEG